MNKYIQTMMNNLYKNTGKTLETWTEMVRKENFEKHGEIIKFLKENHQFTHGFANLVAHSVRESSALYPQNSDDLVASQYQGKEHFKPVYDALVSGISSFGNDIEIAPKKAYVSIRRKKQFAVLKPATKTRFEIGINLKGQEPTELLKLEKPNAMCTHKICIAEKNEITPEILNWLKTAYQKAK